MLLINATRNHYQIQRGFSFLPGKSFTTNLKNVLADANIPILSGIKNSLLVAALSAALSIYFSALTAYGVHAYDFKLKKIASAFIILIMTMPTQVSALGFLRLMTNMKLTDTLIPLFLPSIAAPTVYYFMVSYMKSNLPMEIVEAARIDGSGEFHTFNHVVLPIMKPALAVQAIFTFVASWNNYFAPALILTSEQEKDPPDFDRPAPQRGLPQIRYGSGVHADRHRDHAGHHHLPVPEQVHRRGRRARRREGLTFAPLCLPLFRGRFRP